MSRLFTILKNNFAAAALFIVVGALLGAAIFAYFAANKTPNLLTEPDRVTTAPVTTKEFTDAHNVKISFELGQAHTLSLPVSGTITATTCESGGKLESGQISYSLDGAPVLNLATATPIWRDITLNTNGADILAIQEELIRLGYQITADGNSSQYLINILHALLDENAQVNTFSEISAGQILWLPSSSVNIASCEAFLGSYYEANSPLAKTPKSVANAKVSELPENLLQGARKVVLAAHEIPVDATGILRLADVDFDSLTEVQEAIANNSNNFSATLELVEPQNVSVVPPGALLNFTGDKACVVADGQAQQVTIAGSELGSSFVIFADGLNPKQVSLDAKAAHKCE